MYIYIYIYIYMYIYIYIYTHIIMYIYNSYFINKTGRSGRKSSGRDTFFRSRQRDPNPKDNSLVGKETSTYKGFYSTFGKAAPSSIGFQSSPSQQKFTRGRNTYIMLCYIILYHNILYHSILCIYT